MTIVIGHVTPEELAQYKIGDYKIITKVCQLDRKQEYEIYIINTNITDYGLIQDTEIILDELFITYNICKLFYKLNDPTYLLNSSQFYGVTVYSLNE